MHSLIFPLFSLCWALFSRVDGLTVKIEQEVYEHARGDNITLPCNFKSKQTNPSLVIVTWTALKIKDEPEDTVISTYYSHTGRTDYTKKYEGRSKVDVDVGSGKANLKLNSITLDENRSFECRVQIPGDDEGTPADTVLMVVLVAPSPPVCKIEGKAEYGQDIKLTCHSEEGSPTPTYKWESRDVRNIPRLKDPKTTDVGGVMSLFNITKETSGFYICTSSNKIRSATCNITLAVMPPSMMGSTAATAGFIALGVALLIILIVIIYCCCCKKKKGKDEEYAMGVHEEEYRDKEPAENGERRELRDDARGERDERSDYDDRHADGRSDYNDRRSDYDDRRSDYDDRRSDYTERRSDYDDRRSDYTERRDRYDDDRRDRRYDDGRRYDDDRSDRRYDDDRHYDEAYDDRPPVPNSKPPRRDYD